MWYELETFYATIFAIVQDKHIRYTVFSENNLVNGNHA